MTRSHTYRRPGICGARDRATGQTCTLLDDHANGRHFTDDGISWADLPALVRLARHALRDVVARPSIRRALRRAGAR